MVEFFPISNKNKMALTVGLVTGITTSMVGGMPETAIEMAVGGYVAGRLFIESAHQFLETIKADNINVTRPLLRALKSGLYAVAGSAAAGGWLTFVSTHDIGQAIHTATLTGGLSFLAAPLLGTAAFVANATLQTARRETRNNSTSLPQ